MGTNFAPPAMSKRIEVWPIEKVVPYEKNARTHSEDQVSQIAASILEFGFVNPILVDSNDGIVAGHGRLMAAQKLLMNEVPVVVLDHLTEAQKKAYVIADNKLALNAGWDIDLLNMELGELENLNFDISLLGFSEDELENLAAGGWDSDIDDLKESDGEHLDSLKSLIKIEVDGTFKDEIEEEIKKYCDTHAISVEFK